MARRNTDEIVPDEAIEAEVEEQTADEAPEADEITTENTEQPADQAAKPKAEVNLSSFTSAVESAITQAGDGELDDASKGTVVEAYRELEGQGAKNKARKHLRDEVTRYVMANNLSAAKTLSVLNEVLSEAGSKSSSTPRAAKTPVDPTEAYVQRGAALTIALALHGENKPEGVKDNAGELITEAYNAHYGEAARLLAFQQGDKEGDAPEVADVASDAVRILAGRKTRAASGAASTGAVRTYNGPQRSIAKHIESAFAKVEVGTHLKVADIVNHTSDEYGQDKPSAGAVSSALKSANFKVAGVEPDSAETRPFGATKVATA
jgi:hypothetical protein